MSYTHQQALDAQLRMDLSRKRQPGPEPVTENLGEPREANLHAQIFEECRRRGWIALHGAMSERTHRTPGEFDFVIIADSFQCISGPVTYLIECKARNGKLSPAQQAMHAHARKLGHTPHIVYSFQQFLAILDGGKIE